MLNGKSPVSLSRVLALQMTVVSAGVSFLLMLVFFVHYMSNTAQLREATLHANTLAIAQALNKGKNPAALGLYREYPQSYGFRVFDRRSLGTRHILASANTRWLPAVQRPAKTEADPDGDGDVEGSDLTESFEQSRPLPSKGHPAVWLLIHRVVLGGHKYWIQAYMIGDPAWVGLGVIQRKLVSHVLLPVLFIVPALTLAMFLTTRRSLRPLRRISRDAVRIGSAVARGQTLTPISGQILVQEFADVAAAVNTMLARLERSLQLQKQFTSDAAHELRTPLAVLLLEASQLPRDPARNRIKGDLEELGRLVNELLRFAQAEDVMANEFGEVDIVAVTRKVCEDAATRAIVRGQLIELDCVAPQMIVSGNAVLIEIAVRNLVDNALKYSGPNTTVSVRVDPGPKVVVEDRGPGIPAAQRDVVFERFWRADQRKGNGAGIGLALARRVAELHNGSVRLDDSVAAGTRMVMSFEHPVTRDLARHRTIATAS